MGLGFDVITDFNPLPPHGGRLTSSYASGIRWAFQSTPSAWRETSIVYLWKGRNHISIHSLRMEGDCGIALMMPMNKLFQSTPSAWRETYRSSHRRVDRCISIHSLRMEGDRQAFMRYVQTGISIHSLRMEGDQCKTGVSACLWNFNPLPPHGGRQAVHPQNYTLKTFQSTPSAWRETRITMTHIPTRRNFNPLPPHGGRLCDLVLFAPLYIYFNPLPPHGGRPVYIIAHL